MPHPLDREPDARPSRSSRTSWAARRPLALSLGLLGLGLLALACTPERPGATATADPAPAVVDLQAQADALAHRVIILDGHVDVPIQVVAAEHRGEAPPPVHEHSDTDFDYPRARAGGLDAPFMSIYTPSELQAEPGAAKQFAERSIDYVHGLAAAHPDKFALARNPAEVREHVGNGLIALAMGMENGAPIEGELANLAHFHQRGIRYITLTHGKDNAICDSSYDDRHTHGGLSEFGREVVDEMNRLGIMIDVSHVSDQSFWQVIERSAVPVIASHSSCRHFTPGFERNMSDEMIVALADKGGVIQINFGGSFLSQPYREASEAVDAQIDALLDEHGLSFADPEGQAMADAYHAAHPIPRVELGLVADHIEHVIALVGVDHVGLGSDFDGVGDSLPIGLEDVSMYPNLIRELLARGHGEADIEKICSGNVLRVWQAVEDFSQAQTQTQTQAPTRPGEPVNTSTRLVRR